MPRPTTAFTIALKASIACAGILAVAIQLVLVRPFHRRDSWKGWVRLLLLLDAAGCVSMNAPVTLQDYGLSSVAVDAAARGGAFALFAACVLTMAVLLGGVIMAVVMALIDESRAKALIVRVTNEGPPSSTSMFNLGVISDVSVDAEGVDRHAAVNAGVAAIRPLSEAALGRSDAVSVHHADQQRLQSAIAPRASRRAATGTRPPSRRHATSVRGRLFDPNPKNAMQLLSGTIRDAVQSVSSPDASAGDVIAGCNIIASSCSAMSRTEVSAATRALLPVLSSQMWLHDDAASTERSSQNMQLSSICQAMASLTDRADRKTLTALAAAGIPSQLAALLARVVQGREAMDGVIDAPPPLLNQLVWLVGNVASQPQAAAVFGAAGGIPPLVTLLTVSHRVHESSLSSWREVALHACVALSSLSQHPGTAVLLLDAGMVAALAGLLPTWRPSEKDASAASQSTGSHTLTEAGCGVLRDLLAHAPTQRAVATCAELAACSVISGATVALTAAAGCTQQPPAPASASSNIDISYATGAAAALLGAMRCAASASSQGSSAAAAVNTQAASAGTATVVRRLLQSLGPVAQLQQHYPSEHYLVDVGAPASGATCVSVPSDITAATVTLVATLRDLDACLGVLTRK